MSGAPEGLAAVHFRPVAYSRPASPLTERPLLPKESASRGANCFLLARSPSNREAVEKGEQGQPGLAPVPWTLPKAGELSRRHCTRCISSSEVIVIHHLPKVASLIGAAFLLSAPVTVRHYSQQTAMFGEEPGSCSKLYLRMNDASATVPLDDCASSQLCECADRDLSTCIFAGHSYWGYVCQCIARPRPPRVKNTFTGLGL